MDKEKITLTYESKGVKSTHDIELKEPHKIMEFVGESYSKLYSMLAIDVGIATSILDDFSYEVDLNIKDRVKVSELGIKPEFENVEEFQQEINGDSGFKAFIYDMYKEAFYE